MNTTAEIEQLIKYYHLTPHPEGGFYSETYRSSELCVGDTRSLTTVIYFLLTSQNPSKFHRIKSDEMWFFHSGSPIVIHTLDKNNGHKQKIVSNQINAGHSCQFLVPKNTIFGSTVLNENSYSFVSCVVSPGFEFSDFELFQRKQLILEFPMEKDIIHVLTNPE